MRTLLVSTGLLVVALPLARPLVAEQAGQGNPTGVLGTVNALGQEVKRPPAPTGAAPRLPDGTIDFGDGIWVVVPQSQQASMKSASFASSNGRNFRPFSGDLSRLGVTANCFGVRPG